jgi:phenylpropionate dioxygenase-like ring-hydroxylating dioxygenase large terminal subunit
MSISHNQQNIEQTISKTSISADSQAFDWKKCWYPVTFLQDLPRNQPYSFSLYDEPLVLFRNQDDKLGCLTDLCPHRAAKLSDGQMIDGRIECLYHGWQFGSDGQCMHIPQLPKQAKIPKNAWVKSFTVVERQGIVWMWAGEAEAADETLIPTIPELDDPAFVARDCMSDIPYGQNTFIENVIDPAHVPISHDGILGNRADALPLEMEIINNSAQGFHGRYRNIDGSNTSWNNIDFVAPNLVVVRIPINEQRGWYLGAAAYSLPLSKNQCRFLFRGYQNFSQWQVKLMPRWLDHWYRRKIVEQDMEQAFGQQQHIERLKKSPKQLYLPIKTSDVYPLEYRKWLDKYGSLLPFYQGYSTCQVGISHEKQTTTLFINDRFHSHTKICSSCSHAYLVTNSVKQILLGMAIALSALAILTDNSSISSLCVVGSLFAVVFALVAQKVKTNFERAYTRH